MKIIDALLQKFTKNFQNFHLFLSNLKTNRYDTLTYYIQEIYVIIYRKGKYIELLAFIRENP